MFHRKLMCTARSVTYDFATRTGRLDMARGHCCDMQGCIAMFRDIDPSVNRIETFADAIPDTIYLLTQSKGWSAYLPRNAYAEAL